MWNSRAFIQATKRSSHPAIIIQELLVFYTNVKMSEQNWHRNITYLLGLTPAHFSFVQTSLFNHNLKSWTAGHQEDDLH